MGTILKQKIDKKIKGVEKFDMGEKQDAMKLLISASLAWICVLTVHV